MSSDNTHRSEGFRHICHNDLPGAVQGYLDDARREERDSVGSPQALHLRMMALAALMLDDRDKIDVLHKQLSAMWLVTPMSDSQRAEVLLEVATHYESAGRSDEARHCLDYARERLEANNDPDCDKPLAYLTFRIDSRS